MEHSHDEIARELARVAREIALSNRSAIESFELRWKEREKSREQFYVRVEGWLQEIQKSYATGMIQLRADSASAISSLSLEEGRKEERQRTINKDLYNKFWVAVTGWAAAMTAATVWMIVHYVIMKGS